MLRSGANIGTFCLLDRRPRPDFGAVEEVRARQRQHAEALLTAQGYALREVDRTQHLTEMTTNFGHWRIDGEQWTITWSEGLARIFRLGERARMSVSQAHIPSSFGRLINRAASSANNGLLYRKPCTAVQPTPRTRFNSLWVSTPSVTFSTPNAADSPSITRTCRFQQRPMDRKGPICFAHTDNCSISSAMR